MVTLDNVTIIAVTGVNPKEALWAIEHSCEQIKFASAKLITPHEIKSNKGVEIIKSGDIDYEEYSRFIVYELWKYFETSHVLLVQYDGFVANPEEWSDEFLDYDYIGAPWPSPQDDFSYRDEYGDVYQVGNGGFSLRSKKLCELPTKLNLEWKSYSGFYNEDGFFCIHHRKLLEKNGCKFPSVETAAKFSYETPLENIEFTVPFGFHGKNNSYYSYFMNRRNKEI
jgi:hypothetical protein